MKVPSPSVELNLLSPVNSPKNKMATVKMTNVRLENRSPQTNAVTSPFINRVYHDVYGQCDTEVWWRRLLTRQRHTRNRSTVSLAVVTWAQAAVRSSTLALAFTLWNTYKWFPSVEMISTENTLLSKKQSRIQRKAPVVFTSMLTHEHHLSCIWWLLVVENSDALIVIYSQCTVSQLPFTFILADETLWRRGTT